ncbi:tol-pal system protein [Rhizobium sp. CRIBSB]|nr:tol-pal system protein [Rhizobium sp. CRIBSB]
MLKMSSFIRSRAVLSTAIGLALIGGAVVAQTVPVPGIEWDKRRLDRLNDSVRRLEGRIQRMTGEQVVSLTEPDPDLVALQGRVGGLEERLQDMEQSLQRVNGDLERLTFDLDEARRDNGTLRTRLGETNGRLDRMEREARELAELNAPITANSPTGAAPTDLAAAVRLLGSNPPRGARALEVLTVTWPDTPEAREAHSRLGDLSVAGGDNARAVEDYAAALRGWPTAPWAAETTVKLAAALTATDQDTRACGALGEFTRRYATGSSAGVRAQAAEVKTRAGCR